MVKKLVALSLLAVTFAAHSQVDEQNADLFERTYREGKAKVTKAFKKENAKHLSKAAVYGLLAATGAHFSIKNLIALYNTPKNLFVQKADEGRWNAFKTTGIAKTKAIISLTATLALTAYATYKAGEKTQEHLQKTQE